MAGSLSHPKIQLILEMRNAMRSGLQSAKKMVMREVDEMKTKVSSLKQFAGETIGNLFSGIPGVGDVMGILPAGGKAALIAGGIGLITAAGVKATTMAAGWEKSMAKVNVTAQLQREELRGLSGELKAIAGRNHAAFEEVPEAFNKIISSGMDVNSSLKLLEPTLKAAKAGFTDVETVAKAAVSVMASSGLEDANRLYDILFATLNKGNAEFGDIATYLPKIIPGARSAGLALEETAGAYAYLTAQGFRAEAAATGLQNVFKAFSDGRTIKGFDTIGVRLFDAEGRMRGLMPVLSDLKKSLDGLTDKQRLLKLDRIGLDQEAAMAISSMIQNYEKLGETIRFVTDSQGQFNEAIKNAETRTDRWLVITNRLKQSMTQLGEILLPLVDRLSLGVQGVLDFISWGGGKVENAWRWMQGRQSIRDEWLDARQDEKRKGFVQSVGAKMNDPRINDFVQRDYVKMYADATAAGKSVNVQGITDVSLAAIKNLEDSKRVFESALDSKDKSIKQLLGRNRVKDMNDFYRMMEDNTLTGMVNKLQGMLGKGHGGAATVPGGTTKAPHGVGSVSSGAGTTKNITINIENFIGGNIVSQVKALQNMSKEQLQAFFQESLVRLVRGTDLSVM